MQKMQTLLQPSPLIPVSNEHIFTHGNKYTECLNVTNKGEEAIIDSLLSTSLNLQSHHNPI